ncbi:MAG: response regulator transcription factor [Clostridiales bacterium]|nr:response regulator transcription factor [Clostridiales bacterium]
MDRVTILIVEDDKDLSGVMKDFLVNEGFIVEQVFTGTEAVARAKELKPTLVLLDIMLPGMEGIEVCRKIRTYSHCPILMISAKKSDSDKLLSLGIGADDYITKPFSFLELVGRVKSHLRRYMQFTNMSSGCEQQTGKRTFGKLTIIPESYLVKVEDREITFTSREFQLIDFLSSHPSQVFTKEQLMEAVWGYNEYLDENTIAVYVGRIRDKLEKENVTYIKTVWGVGYKWEM